MQPKYVGATQIGLDTIAQRLEDAGTQIGLDTIAQRLEDAGTLTKTGKNLWRRSFLKTMLCNETYLGVKYFNTMRCVREYAKSREYDGLIETLRDRSKGLPESPALRGNTGAIDAAIAQYCGAARMQFAQRTDLNGQRQFLLDHIEKVVYLNNKVWLHGRVPIKVEHGDTKSTMLTFCIESEITKEERYREKLRTMEAIRSQQSMVPASRGRATLALGHVL